MGVVETASDFGVELLLDLQVVGVGALLEILLYAVDVAAGVEPAPQQHHQTDDE